MSDETAPDRSHLPLEVLDQIDRACDGFEAAWMRGERPRIEDFLGAVAPAYRRPLLRDLLAAEIAARRRCGESPQPREYRERWVDDRAAVDSAFGAAAAPVGAAGPGLLPGLLAYQTGLVNEAELVEALRIWLADKSRPMAEVLEARGAIDAARRALLEGLVAEHLRLHGGDVAASLAALPAGQSTRRRLAELADPDLEATLPHVGSGSRPAAGDGERDRTATFVVGDAASAGRRFRVLRPHARGGLGAVFVALDRELNREVALKQILDHHSDDPISRSRFLVEAEITGGLEHPGIVPVYGLGTYGDGRPYYAMRFVRGDSLKAAIERFHADADLKRDPGRRLLELRKLLRRFTDVCNAIDYAHSRGVVHRDIKPGNVIVGKHGETLVVDWGLAKPQRGPEPGKAGEERPLTPSSSSGSAETLPGSALGTPAYMSPEQAAGDLEKLGPRSDVYSLGATLYCLLTGRAPFEGGDVGAILRAVREGRITPPRGIDPALDRGLEAICLKAMAREPEGRYGSARALADDLDRWLADEPVSAHREGWGRRLARWMRRHRAATQAAAAALAVIAAVSVAAAALINQARVRVDKARLAESQAKAEAQANFARARRTVDEYLTLVSNNVQLRRDLPGLQKFRAELLGKALAYYRAFADEHADNPLLQAEVADAYAQVARVTKDIGSKQQALLDCQKALDWAEAAARAGDEEARRTRVRRAHLYWLRGQAEYGLGRAPEAIRSMQLALDLFGPTAAGADDIDLPRNLGILHNDIGAAYLLSGHQAEAEASFVEARRRLGRALVARADDGEIRKHLGSAENNLGRVRMSLGRLVEAADSFRRARDLDRALFAADPLDAQVAAYLANNCLNLGNALRRQGRLAEAEENFAEGFRVLEPLIARHPDVVLYKEQAANLATQAGDLQMLESRPDDARRSWERARELVDQVIRADPDSSTARVLSASTDNNLGLLEQRAGRLAEADRLMAKGAATLDRFLATHPEQSEARFERANLGYNLGLLARVRGRPVESAGRLDAARAHIDVLRRVDARVAHYRRLDFQLRALRSIVAASTGDLALARDEAGRAESLAKESLASDGGVLYDLACVQAQLGAALARPPAGPGPGADSADYLARAMATLARAVGAGYRDVANLRTDTDLDPIRDRTGFEALLRDAAMPTHPFQNNR